MLLILGLDEWVIPVFVSFFHCIRGKMEWNVSSCLTMSGLHVNGLTRWNESFESSYKLTRRGQDLVSTFNERGYSTITESPAVDITARWIFRLEYCRICRPGWMFRPVGYFVLLDIQTCLDVHARWMCRLVWICRHGWWRDILESLLRLLRRVTRTDWRRDMRINTCCKRLTTDGLATLCHEFGRLWTESLSAYQPLISKSDRKGRLSKCDTEKLHAG